MTRTNTKRALNRVREYYGQIDRFMEQVVNEVDPPCKRGCDCCCYMDVGTSMLEGVIATEIWSRTRPGRKRLVELGTRAEAVSKTIIRHIASNPEFTVKDWLKEKQPCLLLKKGACVAYPMRPVACRTYLVTPDTDCRTASAQGGIVGMWNNHELMELSCQWMTGMATELGESWMSVPASLPVAILFGCTYWLAGSDGVNALMERIGFRDPMDIAILFGEYAMRK